jgi:hypothetical protein
VKWTWKRGLSGARANLGVLVGGIVIHDQMDVEVLGNGVFDALEKAEKLLMPVSRPALGEDGSGGDIEGGEERCGAVTDVVVGDSFHVPEAHRQHRLGAVESLNLRLFIDREHDGVIWRVEIQTHHIAHLLDEEWIVGQLEVLGPVGLDGKGLKDPMHGGFGQVVRVRSLPYAPVRASWRLALECPLQ